MRVAFYLNNLNYEDVDFSRMDYTNPGVRGTQYMIWSVACGLARTYPDLKIILFANIINKMPSDIVCIHSSDEEEALKIAKENEVDIFVLRVSISTPESVFATIRNLDIKCITWSHNFEDYHLAEMIANTPQIKTNVCVGRQQYERLCDHKVFQKSTYIYNALNFDDYVLNSRPAFNNHNVIYIGMLDSSKGFHRLAKLWKVILLFDKKAELHVIGSGSLGSKDTLGPLGIASVGYEKRIVNYICDKKGEILPSIHFHGNMGGTDKIELMSKAKVGIANPTGIGETFCIVAVEFEALGIPVVSAKYGGLLDTVENGKSGLLAISDFGLVKNILKLLLNDDLNRQMGEYGKNSCRNKFGFDLALNHWYDLLTNPESMIGNDYSSFNYIFNQVKICRIINRRIKRINVFSQSPSFLQYEYVARLVVRNVVAITKRLFYGC